jgi:outer membrane biogenesis lipoprotein LolB
MASPNDHEWQVRMLTYQRDAMRSLLERLRAGDVPLPNRAITTVLNRCDDWENRRLTLGEVR